MGGWPRPDHSSVSAVDGLLGGGEKSLLKSVGLCSRIVGDDLVPKQKAGVSGKKEMCVCVTYNMTT